MSERSADWFRQAERAATQHSEIRAIAVIGSYARGDSGVGSDLDVLIEVGACQERFENRLTDLDTRQLPVPAEILVYTSAELGRMRAEGRRFIKETDRDAIGLCRRSDSAGGAKS